MDVKLATPAPISLLVSISGSPSEFQFGSGSCLAACPGWEQSFRDPVRQGGSTARVPELTHVPL